MTTNGKNEKKVLQKSNVAAVKNKKTPKALKCFISDFLDANRICHQCDKLSCKQKRSQKHLKIASNLKKTRTNAKTSVKTFNQQKKISFGSNKK